MPSRIGPLGGRMRAGAARDHGGIAREQTRARLTRGLASMIGNRAVTQVIARMTEGEGILPGGAVHPTVTAAIAASRGQGPGLDPPLTTALETAFGEPLSDVHVHTDDGAAALARAVSARAFTVGEDIYFDHGAYDPSSRDGLELIAHETAHVIQQRGAPTAGTLTVSEPSDATEREADALAREFAG